MIAHSLWEQGRDMASGKIVSMTPFDAAGIGQILGNVPLGGAGMALAAVAQFGIYLEMRRMNLLKEAGFEERRHAWIDDISKQWIEEHRTESGVVRDVSTAVAIECQKMWEKVCENDKTDVPQSVLLRISRICEFLDLNYKLAATASNEIVRQSKSPKSWILNTEENSKSIAIALIKAKSEATLRIKGEWWEGPLKLIGGFPLLLVPVAGTFAAGGAWGAGIVETIAYLRTVHVDFERVEDKIPLLQSQEGLIPRRLRRKRGCE